jgi:FkbM family methyltransferase
MTYHSQSNEAQVIEKYFNGQVGQLLSIGENDGKTFSNSYDLINNGWSAILVEPVDWAFANLKQLHKDNPQVYAYNFAIGSTTGKTKFFNCSDSLLATTNGTLLHKWGNRVTHDVIDVNMYTFSDAVVLFAFDCFDFITVDCEGLDLDILLQMDLMQLGCKCICIEHNGDRAVYATIKKHCAKYGLTKELLYNGENTILAI